MSRAKSIRLLSLLTVGIIFVFKGYIIVIGQTAKPVLVVSNKDDCRLAIMDRRRK